MKEKQGQESSQMESDVFAKPFFYILERTDTSLLLHFDIISLVHRKGTLWAPSGLSGESEDRPKRVVSDADVSVPHQQSTACRGALFIGLKRDISSDTCVSWHTHVKQIRSQNNVRRFPRSNKNIRKVNLFKKSSRFYKVIQMCVCNFNNIVQNTLCVCVCVHSYTLCKTKILPLYKL